MACCQVVDAEVLATDAEQFDCATCLLAAAQAELWPENVDAWRVYHGLARRFVVDAGIGQAVMERHLAGQDPEDALDLIDRLAVIYDLLSPPKAES